MWLGLTTGLFQVKVVSFVGYFSRSESSLNNPRSLSLDSHDNPKSPHDIYSIDSPDNIITLISPMLKLLNPVSY